MPLREQPECVGFFAGHFEQEWPAWYGPGGQGSAIADLTEFANSAGDLPVGVVARADDGSYVGVAALKATSIPEFAHFSPWAGAGFVLPSLRRRGIGAALLSGLLAEARRLKFPFVYCATATAASLLERQGWQLLERAKHDGNPIDIYSTPVSLRG